MMHERLFDRLRTMVGKELYSINSFPIEKGKIREFAMSILEDNPIFYDEKSAFEAGYRSIPAPLTFSQSLNLWNPHNSPIHLLGMDFKYVLHGGQEFEYFKPIVAGDILNAVCRVENVYEKIGSRGGQMMFVITETVFSNQLGERVLTSKATFIQIGGSAKA